MELAGATQERIFIINTLSEILMRAGRISAVEEMEIDPYITGVMVTVNLTNKQTLKMPFHWAVVPTKALFDLRHAINKARNFI